MTQSSLFDGLAIGHQMAELAADKAGAEWKSLALAAFEDYALRHSEFTTEDVRLASGEVPQPPDRRAWGQVALAAKRAELVSALGWTRAKSKSVHGMVVTKWRSRIYSYDNHSRGY